MNPRPYQNAAIKGSAHFPGIIKSLKKSRSTFCCMPTGTGKTVVFSIVTKIAKKRVLILAHRDELINQAAEKVKIVMGISPDIEQAESYAMRISEPLRDGRYRPVVASVQTLHRPERLRSFDPDAFGVIVVDEAHRASKENKSYSSIFEHFAAAKILGVSANADRHDKKIIIGPGNTFETLAFEYLLPEAIHDGWLVPIRQGYVSVEDLDLSKIHTRKGDYDENELAQILNSEKSLHTVVEPTMRLAPNQSGIVFAVNVAHATALAAMFNRYAPGSAVLMHGKITDKDYRARVVKDFKAGNFLYLVNCDVYTEGFDAPNVSVVVNAGITKSRNKYMQRVGRGTRVLPEVGIDGMATAEERVAAITQSRKPNMLVLDFTDRMRQLSLSMSVADILARAELDAMTRRKVANRAKILLDEDEDLDVEDALAEAEKIVDKEKLEAVKGRSRINYNEIDPFDLAQMLASQKQLDLIEKLSGVIPPIDMLTVEANKIIYRLLHRRGTISESQIEFLRVRGYDLDELKEYSHHAADKLIKTLKREAKRLAGQPLFTGT